MPRTTAEMTDRDFPRELAAFVDFVGGDAITRAVRQVEQKLGGLYPHLKSLFADRYFFHAEWDRFVEGNAPFRIDTSAPFSVRAAGFIAAVNRIRTSLSPSGARRLQRMILDNLKADRDLRQIEHDSIVGLTSAAWAFASVSLTLRASAAMTSCVSKLRAPASKSSARLCQRGPGAQIEPDQNARLLAVFEAACREFAPYREPGLYSVSLNRPVADISGLEGRLRGALISGLDRWGDSDFCVEFEAQPSWKGLVEAAAADPLQQIAASGQFKEHGGQPRIVGGRCFGITIQPHKPSTIARSVERALKNAADQCLGREVRFFGCTSLIWMRTRSLS